MPVQAKAIVKGHVQGVFFRASTEKVARGLGLTGYVRNLGSGDVEIVAEGDKKDVEALIAWAHHGPDSAIVTAVDYEFADATGAYAEFRIRG